MKKEFYMNMKLANFSIIKFISSTLWFGEKPQENFFRVCVCVCVCNRFNQMIGVKFSVHTRLKGFRNYFMNFTWEIGFHAFECAWGENPSNRWSIKISLLNSNKRKWKFLSSRFIFTNIHFSFYFQRRCYWTNFLIILAPNSIYTVFHMWRMKSESHTIERERWNLIYGVQVRVGGGVGCKELLPYLANSLISYSSS